MHAAVASPPDLCTLGIAGYTVLHWPPDPWPTHVCVRWPPPSPCKCALTPAPTYLPPCLPVKASGAAGSDTYGAASKSGAQYGYGQQGNSTQYRQPQQAAAAPASQQQQQYGYGGGSSAQGQGQSGYSQPGSTAAAAPTAAYGGAGTAATAAAAPYGSSVQVAAYGGGSQQGAATRAGQVGGWLRGVRVLAYGRGMSERCRAVGTDGAVVNVGSGPGSARSAPPCCHHQLCHHHHRHHHHRHRHHHQKVFTKEGHAQQQEPLRSGASRGHSCVST